VTRALRSAVWSKRLAAVIEGIKRRRQYVRLGGLKADRALLHLLAKQRSLINPPLILSPLISLNGLSALARARAECLSSSIASCLTGCSHRFLMQQEIRRVVSGRRRWPF
jgi:hypothetical protein